MCTSLIEYVSPITTSSKPSARAIAASRLQPVGVVRRVGDLQPAQAVASDEPQRQRASRPRSAGTQEMKRIPVVIIPSGVSGIASLTSRIRSHGSSRWKRTETAMCVLEVKSSAW